MLSDSIAALATPAGRSALAVVRLSGAGALDIAARVVRSEAGAPASGWPPPPRRPTLFLLRGPDGHAFDEGLVTIFRAPQSYTGEDLIEFSCHGGLLAPAQLLAALHEAGARPARPGEFTLRALLNGKLDLLQAEAVGDLIDATAAAQGRAALRQLEGGLSRRIGELRETLLQALALLAYDIDFPEEDDGPVPLERIREGLGSAAQAIETLLATAPAGERLHDGALVVFAGRPNAGKSSLFNALLGVERALVTEIPGTTRDAIEASTEVLGWPVRLADTAGLRESDERLEQMGMAVSRRYMASADLVLLCAEADRDLGAEEREEASAPRTLLVRTKSDLAGAVDPGPGWRVSSATGEGIEALRAEMARRLYATVPGSSYANLEPMLTRERHRVALSRARDALADGMPQVGAGGDAVLAAHHIQRAVEALEELIGVVHPDEVLGRVFASFCIGK